MLRFVVKDAVGCLCISLSFYLSNYAIIGKCKLIRLAGNKIMSCLLLSSSCFLVLGLDKWLHFFE